MKSYWALLIGLYIGVCVSDDTIQLPVPDEEASESIHIQSVKPMTYQTALHNEIQSVTSLVNEVVPPSDKSYWIPYGDRAIVGMTFPVITPEIFKAVPVAPVPVDQYGPPPPVYGPPKVTPKFKPDLGVIISQNYFYKENLRDYGKLLKAPQSRPADEQLVELAKSYATSNTVGPDHVKPDWPSSAIASFVTIAIESRGKTNTPGPAAANSNKPFEFVGDGSVFTNGTIIFPSPNNPAVLTTIPFMLRKPEDIHHIFDGYELDSQGLIPHEKVEIKHFLHLMQALHEDTVAEGKEAVERFRKRARNLKRPTLVLRIDPEDYEDPIKPQEADNRLTTWLHSSTVGIRSFTKPAAQITKLLVPVEAVVPVKKVVKVPVEPPPVLAVEVPVKHTAHSKLVIDDEQPPQFFSHLKA